MKYLIPTLLLFLVSADLSQVTNFHQETITDVVVFEIQVNDKVIGQIQLSLFGKVVPKTVKNFKTICQGTKLDQNGKILSFTKSTFHRIIPKFMIQGGDFTRHDGTGGKSIYGQKFKDQNFQLKHQKYCISMANAGPDTNGSQFFITTIVTSWLDGKHVVFGRVTKGFQVVNKIQQYGSSGGKPTAKVVIKSCKATSITQ